MSKYCTRPHTDSLIVKENLYILFLAEKIMNNKFLPNKVHEDITDFWEGNQKRGKGLSNTTKGPLFIIIV